MGQITTLLHNIEPDLKAYAGIVIDGSPEWEIEHVKWRALDSKDTRARAMIFACESALMSGIPQDELPWKLTYSKAERDANPWIDDFERNDLAVTEACLYPSGERRMIHPMAINGPLCRDVLKTKWRTGVDLGADVELPPGVYVKRLTTRWMKIAKTGALFAIRGTVHERQTFAWAMHDLFMCIQPFRDGNSRTARLLLQMVRRHVGLEPVLLFTSHRETHRDRLKFFRSRIYKQVAPYL